MKSKKAQMFTVIAVLLIVLMLIVVEIYSTIHDRKAIRTRVSSMNNFLLSLETNLQRQAYISGFRMVFLAGGEVGPTYISNITAFFNEAYFNGSVNGQSEGLMIGATHNDMINSINTKASKISVVINMTNTTISMTQNDPWNLRFTITSDFVMSDKQNLALWQKKQNISVLIPVEGFEDPFFKIKSGGRISRLINRTIYDGNFVNGADVSNLSDHFAKGYYANNSNAPSFLNRLQGNFSSDPNGIETFVDTDEFAAEGLTIYPSSSVVDYLYFLTQPSGSVVSGMPNQFKIDDAHKSRYQIP